MTGKSADTAPTNNTSLVGLTWIDLCGIARVRGIPLKHLQSKREHGLSFPSSGQAMSMFGDLVENPWGGLGDVRQIPVMASFVEPGGGNFGMVLSEAIGANGASWDLCARTLLRKVTEQYRAKFGLTVSATFEQEFRLLGEKAPALSMTVEALRQISPLDESIVSRLEGAGIQVEAFEPEFVPNQYEISVAPREALRAADEAAILREIVRDSARASGYKATFAPKTDLATGGSGLHIHISLADESGNAVLFDPRRTSNLSQLGAGFVGGILARALGVLPFVAPGVSSYYRLGPGKWSSGYAAYGTANREAMVRLCSLPTEDEARKAKSFNIEFRAADGLCNPYLALAVILIAGMQGMEGDLPLPPAFEVDASKCSPAELRALQLVPLPTSLEESLANLEAATELKAALPPTLVDIFVALRKHELRRFVNSSPNEVCAEYVKVY